MKGTFDKNKLLPAAPELSQPQYYNGDFNPYQNNPDYVNSLMAPPTYRFLDIIENTYKAKSPYGMLVFSSTGLYAKEWESGKFQGHQPIRGYFQIYRFDEAQNKYIAAECFDKLIQATSEAIEEAERNATRAPKPYDVFKEGGIDKTSYLAGINVISPEEFKVQFLDFIRTNNDLSFIIANGFTFVDDSLRRVGVTISETYNKTFLRVNSELTNGKVIDLCDQAGITGQYFELNHYDAKNGRSLETLTFYLRQYKGKGDKLDQLKANYKGAPLRVLNIQLLLETFAEEKHLISEKEINKEPEQHEAVLDPQIQEGISNTSGMIKAENKSEPILENGTEKPVEVQTIPESLKPEKVKTDSESKTIYHPEPEVKTDPVSEKGFEIQNTQLYKNVQGLVDAKIIDPKTILDPDSNIDLHRAFKVCKNDLDGNVGFSVLKVMTTTENTGNVPIQICLLAMDVENLAIKNVHKESQIYCYIKANAATIQKELTDDPQFFEKRGIDQNEYDEKAISRSKVFEKVLDFFEEYPFDKYPLIASQDAKETLSKFGNLDGFEKNFIDEDKVVQQYLYLAVCERKLSDQQNFKTQVLVCDKKHDPYKYENKDLNINAFASYQDVFPNSYKSIIYTSFILFNITKQEEKYIQELPTKNAKEFIPVSEPVLETQPSAISKRISRDKDDILPYSQSEPADTASTSNELDSKKNVEPTIVPSPEQPIKADLVPPVMGNESLRKEADEVPKEYGEPDEPEEWPEEDFDPTENNGRPQWDSFDPEKDLAGSNGYLYYPNTSPSNIEPENKEAPTEDPNTLDLKEDKAPIPPEFPDVVTPESEEPPIETPELSTLENKEPSVLRPNEANNSQEFIEKALDTLSFLTKTVADLSQNFIKQQEILAFLTKATADLGQNFVEQQKIQLSMSDMMLRTMQVMEDMATRQVQSRELLQPESTVEYVNYISALKSEISETAAQINNPKFNQVNQYLLQASNILQQLSEEERNGRS